jgi:hypothetical protein
MIHLGRDNAWAPEQPDGRIELIGGTAIATFAAFVQGGAELAKLEVPLADWLRLPPVRHAVARLMEWNEDPIEINPGPRSSPAGHYPCGSVEHRNGEDRAVITGCRAGTQDAVTVEMPWHEWLEFPLVEAARAWELLGERANEHFEFTRRPEWPRVQVY